MKTPRLLVLLLAAFFATLVPRPAQANVEVSFDFFYDSLSPYGEWLEVADYGSAWRPTEVDRDWAPYADGYWAFTDAGWTWVSYEDFGGIVYHYGRWVFVNGEGWCWVPDYEWGPAWVSWRHSDDHVGWAPLPPEARWQPTIGISIWADRQYDIGPGYYSFCRVRDFGAPVLRPVIINRLENVTIIRRTVNITNITYNTHYGDRRLIYNGGPSYESINRRSERRVPALKLVQNREVNLPGSRDWNRDRDGRDRDGQRRNFNARAEGNQLVVTAPRVRPLGEGGANRPQATRTVAADKVTRGWNAVKNEGVRNELRQEMQRQTRGLTPETAPARAVVAAELEPVPEKADPKSASPVATRDRGERREQSSGTAGERGAAPSTAPTATATAPEGRASERPAQEKNGREQTPRGTERPVAGQRGLQPFTPGAATAPQTPVTPAPAATPDARVAKPGEDPARTRDGRSRAEATAEEAQRPERDGGRRGEMARPTADAAAAQPRGAAEQENSRRKQTEAAAEQQRGAEKQGQADALREQQQAGERQKMQAERERAARQESEASNARKKQDAQQRATQEAARAQGAERAREQQQQQEMDARRRQQSERQAADQQQQRRKMAEQTEAQRQQVERAAGDQRRQREESQAVEQSRRPQPQSREPQPRGEQSREQQSREQQPRGQSRQPQPAPPAAPPRGEAVPAEPDNGRGGQGRGR